MRTPETPWKCEQCGVEHAPGDEVFVFMNSEVK